MTAVLLLTISQPPSGLADTNEQQHLVFIYVDAFFFFISGHCALSQDRETAVTCQPERSSRQQRLFKACKLVSL